MASPVGRWGGGGHTGGRKYRTAALGVQQEVEDIRSELVKLLRTLNSTNAGILGAEHELKEKVEHYIQQ